MFSDRINKAHQQNAATLIDAMLEARVSCAIYGRNYFLREEARALMVLFTLEKSGLIYKVMGNYENNAKGNKDWNPEETEIIKSFREVLNDGLLPGSSITFEKLLQYLKTDIEVEKFADFLCSYVTGQLNEISKLQHNGIKIRQFECNMADIAHEAKKIAARYENKLIDCVQFITPEIAPSEKQFIAHMHGKLGEMGLPEGFIKAFHKYYDYIVKEKEYGDVIIDDVTLQEEVGRHAYQITLADFDFEKNYEEFARWTLIERVALSLGQALENARDNIRQASQGRVA